LKTNCKINLDLIILTEYRKNTRRSYTIQKNKELLKKYDVLNKMYKNVMLIRT